MIWAIPFLAGMLLAALIGIVSLLVLSQLGNHDDN